MQFMIKAYDGEGMLEKRMEVRPLHLEGMKKLGRHIVCAGGLLDDDGKMKGSALIVDFSGRAALEEYLSIDRMKQQAKGSENCLNDRSPTRPTDLSRS